MGVFELRFGGGGRSSVFSTLPLSPLSLARAPHRGRKRAAGTHHGSNDGIHPSLAALRRRARRGQAESAASVAQLEGKGGVEWPSARTRGEGGAAEVGRGVEDARAAEGHGCVLSVCVSGVYEKEEHGLIDCDARSRARRRRRGRAGAVAAVASAQSRRLPQRGHTPALRFDQLLDHQLLSKLLITPPRHSSLPQRERESRRARPLREKKGQELFLTPRPHKRWLLCKRLQVGRG